MSWLRNSCKYMSVKQTIIHGRGPGNINQGIVAGFHNHSLLSETMICFTEILDLLYSKILKVSAVLEYNTCFLIFFDQFWSWHF